jgi:hypothetical protein
MFGTCGPLQAIKIYEIKITMANSFCMGVMQSQSLGVTVWSVITTL